ncbi:MAG: helix-turn-helix domain-containing protein [Mycoplasmataceae bacterium]|jgi:transcriptional regulator with XRE-family HTH domain|nr:helix-turn-helix domain-containing protein [Mycoplasmataceae bacterium]
MNLNEQVAKRIKELRIKHNLTQEELSFKLGLAHSSISQIEALHGRNITLKTIQRICKTLNISIEDFFKGIK